MTASAPRFTRFRATTKSVGERTDIAADSNTSEPRVIAYDQRLAKIVVAAIKGLPISPNVLTALGMIVGIASGFLYAQGARDGMIAGSLLFMVAVWMDHVDGEFARATGKTSKFGHYFDHVAAMTSYCAMFIGAGYGLRDTWLGDSSVICGISAGVSVALIFSRFGIRGLLRELRAAREGA